MLISFGSGRQPPGVCLLIVLPAYKAGASQDSEQPPEAAEVGQCALSFCRMHLDARVCWRVCVPVRVSEGVSARFCVCVSRELMPLQSWRRRAGCLEASPRSRQLQPDMGESGDWPGGRGRGPRGSELGDPGHKSPPCWCRWETEAKSEAGRQEEGGRAESQAERREGRAWLTFL